MDVHSRDAERSKVGMSKILAITRRDFLFMSTLALGGYALRPLYGLASPVMRTASDFLKGVNYPWIGYGHDFGKNAWGHDGLITCGWSYQTWTDSQGFTDTRRSTDRAHSGIASL